jgi:hypothetical protein
VTVQDAEGRIDRVALGLLPGPGSIRQAQRFVRGYVERSGAESEATERMVQLIAEHLGPGNVPVTLAIEELPSEVRLSLQLRSAADYAAVRWWRTQHPLGIDPWRLYVSRLAGERKEVSHPPHGCRPAPAACRRARRHEHAGTVPLMSRGVTPRDLVDRRTSASRMVDLAYGPFTSSMHRTDRPPARSTARAKRGG